ncbi:unnamed protein product [Pleuronectes platessa]|uniref:Uncharacterized protein n=1 Tax=Pleuronectes platessa TaxID=8262 RepID=A0A9N7U8K2_PLEPL|nr:unnamed protein product [Pleuronectes platessa]
MLDYYSYRHTEQPVRKILEQPATQGLAPEVQELVDSIQNVLQSDQATGSTNWRGQLYLRWMGKSRDRQ